MHDLKIPYESAHLLVRRVNIPTRTEISIGSVCEVLVVHTRHQLLVS